MTPFLVLFGVLALTHRITSIVNAQLIPPECKAERPPLPPDKPSPKITIQVYLDVKITSADDVSEHDPELERTDGRIVLGLFGELCPKTVENFRSLIAGTTRETVGSSSSNGKSGGKPLLHYNGTIFHRVVTHFMIQGGDITHGNGVGGESIYGKVFPDEECIDKLIFDKPFFLAMANRGPNTNNSQFFITTVKTRWLDSKHTIFGNVLGGFDVVRALEKLGTSSGKPSKRITIVDSGFIYT